MVTQLCHYALMAALRDKIILSFLVLAGLGISLSIFLGSAAIIEQEQFSIVYAASGLRFVGVLGLSLFVVFYIRRAFEDKDIEFLLSRPVSRPVFILAHSLAFSLIALIMAVIVCACVFLTVPQEITQGHMLWGFSILMEFIIIVNASIFFAMVLPSATMASMAVLAFYALSRMMGQLLGIAAEMTYSSMFQAMGQIMDIISVFIPRLDLMGQTSWLIYGVQDDVGFLLILLQGVLCSVVLVLASMIDLVRRQF